jgi:hypothetical protein
MQRIDRCFCNTPHPSRGGEDAESKVMKKYSVKEVQSLVIFLVVVFAFMNTSSAIWTSDFWRQFIYNIFVYGAITEVAILIFYSFKKEDE